MHAALPILVEKKRDAFLADLTEAALAVAGKHGVSGSSVELEIDLWNALKTALRDRADRESHDQAEHHWEERIADLADTAYHVLLQHPFCDAFGDLQNDLWKSLRQVIRRDRFLPANGAESKRLSGLLAIY
jgi:hypothetical protein